VAPRGRGASHAWARAEALADVDEALDDALAATGADPARVVLAGFSMGGYGVYRKFLDAPERFRALAVFSGHPDLANRWTGTRDHPNLLDPAVAARFRGIRLFVFHGAKDRNTPFELTEQAVAALRRRGRRWSSPWRTRPATRPPSPATLARFRAWLARVLASP
jgi:Dipeptidyl aminopeptidases/acylaminoacyl-peptidases